MANRYFWFKVFLRVAFLLFFCTLLSQKVPVSNNTIAEQKVNAYLKKADYFLNKNLDSAKVYANKSLQISEQNKLYLQTCSAYQTLGKIMYLKPDYTKALEYFNLQKKTALSIKNSDAYVFAINNIANVMIDLGKTDEAESIYKEVLEISKNNNNLKGISTGYNNLAYIARMKGNNAKAIEYIFEKIKIDEQLNNTDSSGNSYQQLAVIYLRKGDWQNARMSLEKSNEYFQKANNDRNLAINLQLSSVIYEGKGDYAKAIDALQNSVKINEKFKDNRTLAVLYNELGRLNALAKKPNIAEEMFQKSLQLHKEINLKKTLPSVLISYGKSQLDQNKMQASKDNILEGLKIAQEMKSAINEKEAFDALTEWYIKNNDTENALKYKKEFIKMNDSLLNEKNNKLLSELNVKYETEKKEGKIKLLDAENKLNKIDLAKNKLQLEKRLLEINTQNLKIQNQNLELDKQNLAINNKNLEINNKNLEIHNNQEKINKQKQAIINKEQKIKLLDTENRLKKLEIEKKNASLFALLGSIFILMLLSYLFYNRYKIKQEAKLQKEIMHQQDLATKAVMNAEDNERKRMAIHLHDGVGQLLTATNMNLQVLDEFKDDQEAFEKVVEKTKNILKEAITEVRTLSHQIMPNMLIKNSLSNALKELIDNTNSPKLHINLKIEGLKDNLDENVQIVMFRVIQECINNTIKHADASEVFVKVFQNEKIIEADFQDNGKGFSTNEISSKSEGMGLENIKSRIEFLKGKFDVESEQGKGTKIHVKIPLQNV